MTRRLLPLVAAFSLLGSNTASAEWRGFSIQCYPGALQACVSVTVGIVRRTWIPSWGRGGYDIIVRVSNLQGTRGFENGNQPVGLRYVFLRNLVTDGLDGATHYPLTTTASAEGNASLGEAFMEMGLYGTSFYQHADNGIVQPIFGCSRPEYPDNAWQYGSVYTCGGSITSRMSVPTDGFIGFSDQTTLGLEFVTEDWGLLTCFSGETCTTSVVPEPITVVLLGTGLAGLGAMRARRRKKDELA